MSLIWSALQYLVQHAQSSEIIYPVPPFQLTFPVKNINAVDTPLRYPCKIVLLVSGPFVQSPLAWRRLWDPNTVLKFSLAELSLTTFSDR